MTVYTHDTVAKAARIVQSAKVLQHSGSSVVSGCFTNTNIGVGQGCSIVRCLLKQCSSFGRNKNQFVHYHIACVHQPCCQVSLATNSTHHTYPIIADHRCPWPWPALTLKVLPLLLQPARMAGAQLGGGGGASGQASPLPVCKA